MVRKTNANGMKAIIKHNTTKQLSKMQLTKKDYDKLLKLAENYIDSASMDDLKQKGITKTIITEISQKPKIIGEGKRKRENDDEENKRKLFENVDPKNIHQLTIQETTSIPSEVLEEPKQTQPKPIHRSWFNRVFSKRPEEKQSRPEPKLRPYTSLFDPYITGRVLPSSSEIPRRQHYTRSEAEISAERHKTNEHRNTLNEITKDITRRQHKQETQFMHENEQTRRKALEGETRLFLEGKQKLGPARITQKTSSTESRQNPLSDIARRRQEMAQKHSS